VWISRLDIWDLADACLRCEILSWSNWTTSWGDSASSQYCLITLSSISAEARNKEKQPGLQRTQPKTCSAAFWNQCPIAYSNCWNYTNRTRNKEKRWMRISGEWLSWTWNVLLRDRLTHDNPVEKAYLNQLSRWQSTWISVSFLVIQKIVPKKLRSSSQIPPEISVS